MDLESVEHELARRARDGDQEALAQLVEQERLSLFTLAYTHLRHYDDAQDVLAATLLQICRHIAELREPQRVRAWMQTILRNEARQCRRHSFPEPLAVEGAEEVEERPCGSSAAASEAEAVASLMRLDILRALRRLPWVESRAVALFYLASLPIREIAQHLHRPEGTIKRWLYLGRQHLATELEDYAPRGWAGRIPTRERAAPLDNPENRHGRSSIQ